MEHPNSTNNPELLLPPELLERALSAAAEGITIADARLPDQPLIYCNEGFERLTGYSRAEAMGRNCRFLQGPNTDADAIGTIRNSVEEKRQSVVEILNYRKDGKPFWNRLSITPVYDNDGDVTHFIGVQSDVTERRNAEEALRRTTDQLEETNKEMSKDLELAARVQQSLLPWSLPTMRGVNVAWALESCDELAGDTLGVLQLSDSELGVFVADVAGHGVASSLLSFSLTHWFDQHFGTNAPKDEGDRRQSSSPITVAESLNKHFPIDIETGQYFTLIYGILDRSSRKFRYVCAGHPPPVHIPVTGNATCPKLSSFPIGVSPQPQYAENVVRLEPGDRILLYSDGLVEVENSSEHDFGIDRVIDYLTAKPARKLDKTVGGLLRSVKDWIAPRKPADDITLLGIELD